MAEGKKYSIIALSDELRSQIEALVGPNQLGAFLAEAAERELKRRHQAEMKWDDELPQGRVYIN
jgi:hypothetical protein